MERRTKLALVIIVGLILFLLGLYLLLSPYLAERKAAQQPPTLPGSAPGFSTGGKPGTNGQGASPVSTGTVPPVSNDQRTIENSARSVVERVGSGTSGNGFLGYQDALLSMTPSGQAALLKEQQGMQTEHPVKGPAFGISTHGISSLLTGGQPGDATVNVTVQAIQTQDSGNPSVPKKTMGKQVIVTFVRQVDGGYLVDALAWTDIQL